MQVDAELVRDHVRERGLAEAGRAGEQEVIERPAVLLRRAHRDLEVVDQLALADVLVERARPQRGLPRLLAARSAARDLARRLRRRVDVRRRCASCAPLRSPAACSAAPGAAASRCVASSATGEVARPPARPRPAASPCRRARVTTSSSSGCRFGASRARIAPGRRRDRPQARPARPTTARSISHFSCSSTTSSSAVFLPMPLILRQPGDVLARDQRRDVARRSSPTGSRSPCVGPTFFTVISRSNSARSCVIDEAEQRDLGLAHLREHAQRHALAVRRQRRERVRRARHLVADAVAVDDDVLAVAHQRALEPRDHGRALTTARHEPRRRSAAPTGRA